MKIKTFFKRIHRCWDYVKLGWKDEDWDYGYLLKLERFKIEKMQKYFEKSDIAADGWSYARDLKILSKLYDIIEENDTYYDYNFAATGSVFGDGHFTAKPNMYVNIRNAERFVDKDLIEKYITNPNIKESLKVLYIDSIRYEKAWNLYHKIMTEKMRNWWD